MGIIIIRYLIICSIVLCTYAGEGGFSYGFAIPIPNETFTDSKVRQLVNDLLREDIPVFWCSSDFVSLSSKLDSQNVSLENFNRGAFVVPFTGDISKDTLATVIAFDYYTSSEISEDNLHIDIYNIAEPITVKGYRLVEPRIAQHLGTPTRYGWPCYLQIAEAGGFFSMEFLLDNETFYLNKGDFNVFMWPYLPDPASALEVARTLSNKTNFNIIRKFVRSGGGYIGSCYGAIVASSGLVYPIPIFSLLHAYLPELPISKPYITFSVSDSLMKYFLLEDLSISTVEIINTSHPLSFGINRKVKEFFGGPTFCWMGENTHTIAKIIELRDARAIGSPTWVESKFGKGKIILFTGHPEFVINISILLKRFEWEGDKYYGRRIIHNSLFYVTSDDLQILDMKTGYPLALIEKIGEKTRSLPLPPRKDIGLHEIKRRIATLNENLSCLRNFTSGKENRLFLYIFHFCNIFSDFNNKTLVALKKLESVCSSFNKSKLLNRLNNSIILVSKVLDMADKNDARKMLRTLEIGLKYIPQMYFECEKLLRHCWYNYEVKV